MIEAEDIIRALGMKPLPREGGYFTESYRSPEVLPDNALPHHFGGQRPLATAIYYLLTPDTFSAMHRLRSDEIFHFYLGDPVEMLLLHPDGGVKKVTLGPDILHGMRAQVVVPRNVWQGSRLVGSGRFALMGTTVSPGFHPEDYEHGDRNALIRSYPVARETILALTQE
jgi:predicted cupin superfamily sugar epimerase